MGYKNRFKKTKSSEKTSADLNLDAEIEKLEAAIAGLSSNGIPVPDSMAQELAKLKAKRNPNKFNAKKFVYKDIEYDSVREARFAEALDKAGLEYKYQVEIELQPAFKLEHENVQDICIIVDFLVDEQFFVDIKGMVQDVFKLKWKILKCKYKHTKEYFIINKDSDIAGFIAMAKSKQWKENSFSV